MIYDCKACHHVSNISLLTSDEIVLFAQCAKCGESLDTKPKVKPSNIGGRPKKEVTL